MDRYLIDKFKGKYRVMAHLDEQTNDFPRNYNGEVDEDFSDFYIKCRNNIEIKHGVGKRMMVYIPSKTKGLNVLKKMYEDSYGKKWEESDTKNDTKYYDGLINKVVAGSPVICAEALDGEVTIDFYSDDIKWIAKFVHPVTSGANISPLSKRNLYKTKYVIPDEDVKKCKAIEESYPKRKMTIKGKTTMITDGLYIRKVNTAFEEKKVKELNEFSSIKDLEYDKKKIGVNGKEYFHIKGWWNDYLNFCDKYANTFS